MIRSARRSTKQRTVRGLIGLCASLLLLAGCGEGQRGDTAGQKELVRIGFSPSVEVATLDPAELVSSEGINVPWLVCQRLVATDSTGALIPQLAKRWEVLDGGRRWRFALDADATFYDPASKKGIPVTAEDVRRSIERAASLPSYGQTLIRDLIEGADAFVSKKAERISGIQVLGSASDPQIEFRLTAPNRYFGYRLATSFYSVLPAGGFKIDFGQNLAGSGSYFVETYDKIDGRIVLSRVPGARGSKGPARIHIRFYGAPRPLVQALLDGDIDIAKVNPANLNLLPTPLPSTLKLLSHPGDELKIVVFNYKHFGRSPELRRYLQSLVRTSDLVKLLGYGEGAQGPVPPSILRQLPPEHPIDRRPTVRRTLELLVEDDETSRIIAQWLKQVWGDGGVKVEVVNGGPAFFDRLVSGKYELALAYYGSFYPHADPYLWPYLKRFIPVPNVMGYMNPSVENTYDRFVASETGTEALRGILTALGNDPPAVWLLVPPQIYVAKASVLATVEWGGMLSFK